MSQDALKRIDIHADPVDRIIIATAEARRLPVVTADAVFASYDIEVFV